MRRKPIRFSVGELNAIISMAAIASAAVAEGDYQDWTDKRFNAAATAAQKAHKLLARK